MKNIKITCHEGAFTVENVPEEGQEVWQSHWDFEKKEFSACEVYYFEEHGLDCLVYGALFPTKELAQACADSMNTASARGSALGRICQRLRVGIELGGGLNKRGQDNMLEELQVIVED